MSEGYRPKPMTQDEFDACVRKIGWAESEVRRRVGIPVLPTRRRIKPADFTRQQVRCIRFLALNAELRSKMEEVVKHFPQVKMLAVRPVEKTAAAGDDGRAGNAKKPGSDCSGWA